MTSALAIKEKESYTYADYLKWPEGERWEIIEGKPYNMSPAPATRHQRIAWELSGQIRDFLKGKDCEGFAAPFDVRLDDTDNADAENLTVVQPDISVICDPDKIDERGCKGAPDWIIEIISPATASRDYILKRELYEKYGVKEYWLLHPSDRILTVFRMGEMKKYLVPEYYDAQAEVEVKTLPGLKIVLPSLFGE